MAANGKAENRIRIDQLCIGLHVKLDSWMGHPFLFSSFRIKNEKQIAALRSMGLTDIEYVPEKSKASPPPISATPATSTPPTADEASALDELMREKKVHRTFPGKAALIFRKK
jgi:hypothetical protein